MALKQKISLKFLLPLILFFTCESLFAFTITDSTGQIVYFDKKPQRIVLAGRGVVMVANAVYLFPEASSHIVAISRISQGRGDFLKIIDPDYSRKKVLATDVGPEQIAAIQPDVVILKSYLAEKLGKPLQTIGINVVYLDFETPDHYEHDLWVLGGLFQNKKRAYEVLSFYRERILRVMDSVGDLYHSRLPRVLLLSYSERDGRQAFNVPPLSWMQTIMVWMAGGYPVWRDGKVGKGWTKISFEQIAAWDPDQIYVTAYFDDVDDVVTTLRADPKWQSLTAVSRDKLYAFPSDFYSWDQPDTRWILGLMWLASKIHPDRFSELDIMVEVQSFYRELYAQDSSNFDRFIKPLLNGDIP